MTKHFILFLLLTTVCSAVAQRKTAVEDVKYRRSSLYTILMESADYPMKSEVENTFVLAPFPDKYNMHVVGPKTFNPLDYGGELGIVQPDLKKKRGLNAGAAGNEEDRQTIERFLETEAIARKMVAMWFNRDSNGVFSMDLIGERGFYNASEMESRIAEGSARGLASLADAGEELIKNSFVVVQKLSFVENEPFARAIRDIAVAAAEEIEEDFTRDLAKALAESMYLATKDGYSAVAIAYLFQLEWSDSVAAVFYNDFWVSGEFPDSARVAAFDSSKIFSLRFVGAEKASSSVLISAGRTMEEIIHLATTRNIDNVYAKLQKKYDVFKTKTPLYSTDPLTAQIGKKEGLKGGEKFEVLEQTIDAKTGKTKYVRKGVITVDKKRVWDNRYMADAAPEVGEVAADSGEASGTNPGQNGAVVDTSSAPSTPVEIETDGNPNDNNDNMVINDQPVNVTFFKGGSKKYYSGMLIRQIK